MEIIIILVIIVMNDIRLLVLDWDLDLSVVCG